MKLLQESKRIECVHYSRDFEWADMPGAGFGFPCDENGTVDEAALSDTARENYRRCLAGEFIEPHPTVNHIGLILDKGVSVARWSYIDPAVGECVCGAHVELHGFTNTCDRCDRDYNSAGQLLGPREFWGEETGESLGDILGVDTSDPWRD